MFNQPKPEEKPKFTIIGWLFARKKEKAEPIQSESNKNEVNHIWQDEQYIVP